MALAVDTWLAPIDMTKNEIRNQRVHVLGSAPSSPVTGQIYYDSGTNKMYYYNGSSWIDTTGGAVTFGSPGNSAVGDTASDGVASTASRTDHRHGREAFGAAGNSAVADAAANGTATTVSHSDHTHGREGFGAVSAQTSFGASSGNGTATTTSHSDHTHGTPAHTTAAHQEMLATADLTDWPRVAALDLNSQKLTGLQSGTADTDAVNFGQLTSLAAGVSWKERVRVATTAAGTLASSFENGDSVDGVTLATGDRILIKNQATGADNGIYVVAASGAPARATDADSSAEVKGGLTVRVTEGTTNADTQWTLFTDDPITLGTTALTFTQTNGLGEISAGNALTKTGNTLNVVGTAGRISVAADSLDIDSAYVGQASITTLGTITTGVWTGTDVAVADGGTGSSTAAGARTNLGATGKASANVGDNSATTIDFAHNLNTTDVSITLRENTVPGTVVHAVTQVKDANTVTFIFSTAPTTNQYRATVVG